MALLAEISVFILLDPDLSKIRLALMILGANLLAVLIGFGIAYAAQWALVTMLGDSISAWVTPLSDVGLVLAVLIAGVVKCVIWTFSFGHNLYLRRVVIVTHLLSFGVLCITFYALPYFGNLRLPQLPF